MWEKVGESGEIYLENGRCFANFLTISVDSVQMCAMLNMIGLNMAGMNIASS